MLINKVHLVQFRNYIKETVFFDRHVNIFVGDNAQGKTNLLESLFFVSLLKSFRNHGYNDLFFFEKDFFSITLDMQRHKQNHRIQVAYQKKERKLAIDGVVLKKMNEFIGYLNVVVFTPDDLLLIKGSPTDRRRLLDVELSKISPVYLYELSKFYHLLKQRNRLLKRTIKHDDIHLVVLTEQLIDVQIKLYKRRLHFLNRLNDYLSRIYADLTNGEACHFDYHSFLNNHLDLDAIRTLYDHAFLKDSKLKSTSIGIHRDDLVFYVQTKKASDFASQGQQRTVVLALKMALIEIVHDEIGEYPVLLLDDVLSELDDFRKNRLFDLVNKDIQTFITTTSLDGLESTLIDQASIFFVKNGHVLKEDYDGRKQTSAL